MIEYPKSTAKIQNNYELYIMNYELLKSFLRTIINYVRWGLQKHLHTTRYPTSGLRYVTVIHIAMTGQIVAFYIYRIGVFGPSQTGIDDRVGLIVLHFTIYGGVLSYAVLPTVAYRQVDAFRQFHPQLCCQLVAQVFQ